MCMYDMFMLPKISYCYVHRVGPNHQPTTYVHCSELADFANTGCCVGKETNQTSQTGTQPYAVDELRCLEGTAPSSNFPPDTRVFATQSEWMIIGLKWVYAPPTCVINVQSLRIILANQASLVSPVEERPEMCGGHRATSTIQFKLPAR